MTLEQKAQLLRHRVLLVPAADAIGLATSNTRPSILHHKWARLPSLSELHRHHLTPLHRPLSGRRFGVSHTGSDMPAYWNRKSNSEDYRDDDDAKLPNKAAGCHTDLLQLIGSEGDWRAEKIRRDPAH